MTLYHAQDTIRLLPGGAGESGATVTFKLVSDDSTITTATTDSDGFFQKSLAATATTGESSYILHPGPHYYEVTVGSYTRRHSSQSIGTAGPLDLSALTQLNRALGSGLISAPANGLNTGEVTSAGAARTVVVATFAAVIEGLPVWNDAARTLTIGANATGSTRIDTVVVEMVPAGNATEGKCTLKVVEGTTSQPTLTQSTVLWQLPLANVSVSNGASVITQGNITDRRDYVERSVTAVEADVVALEARVDDLEAGLVPRLDLIGWHSATVDIANMAANAGITVAYMVGNLAVGITEFAAGDIVMVSHAGFNSTVSASINAWWSGTGVEVNVNYYNHSASAFNPASNTLYIRVIRPVTI